MYMVVGPQIIRKNRKVEDLYISLGPEFEKQLIDLIKEKYNDDYPVFQMITVDFNTVFSHDIKERKIEFRVMSK